MNSHKNGMRFLCTFIFLIFFLARSVSAEILEEGNVPKTTSHFSLSTDSKFFRGGLAIPVFSDPTESQLLYTPSHLDINSLTNNDFGTNNSNGLVISGEITVQAASATFTVNFLNSGNTDATGQVCGTFPNSVQAVFTAAANIWGSILQSSVPISIDACWASFSGNVLGYAGSQHSTKDFSGAPIEGTWYPIALANALAGSDLQPNQSDIFATFNSNFSWYYGIDGSTPSSQQDLLSVILHEIGHGLGFSGSAAYSNGLGNWGSGGFQDIYDNFIKDASGNKITDTSVYPNPSASLGSLLTSNNLWFTGSNAVTANNSANVKLYAPATWSSGSSYSHLDYNTFNNTSNQLMVYAISPGEAIHDPGPVGKGLLADLGWQLAGDSSIPGKATLVSPSGSITDSTPTYAWNAVSGTTWYYLWVKDSSSGSKIKTWYTASAAGCSAGTGTCSVTPSDSLEAGAGIWWIQTYNTSGYGPWSSGKTFDLTTTSVPGKATLVTPSGSITDSTPTYTWNAVSGTTWYYLWVKDSSSGSKIKTWYTASAAGCSAGTGTCSVTPSDSLEAGAGTWWIQTYNTSGYGPWSSGKMFDLTATSVSGKATLVTPSGSITDSTPTYTWNAVSGATWYYLWVKDSSSGSKIKTWYTASAAGCSAGTGTCSVTPSDSLEAGAGTWWIQTYNTSGYGPWSSGKTFDLTTTSAPGKATLVTPSGSITDSTPTYTWNAVSGATWYYLWVKDSSSGSKIKTWYTASAAGCSADTGTCSVTPSTSLEIGTGTWWIQTYNTSGYGPWSSGKNFEHSFF
uniref:Type IV fimbrial biogenesis protein PilY1 n=1 Tax=uncultured Thiotrichaceae bacterium TaxID=298394 RepID=A0A6S6UM50_9GAMM|nr:MAG: Type IV fimbrial biogenesis protein PilY1 [uncultured Thiotrichaceae bacterium]